MGHLVLKYKQKTHLFLKNQFTHMIHLKFVCICCQSTSLRSRCPPVVGWMSSAQNQLSALALSTRSLYGSSVLHNSDHAFVTGAPTNSLMRDASHAGVSMLLNPKLDKLLKRPVGSRNCIRLPFVPRGYNSATNRSLKTTDNDSSVDD